MSTNAFINEVLGLLDQSSLSYETAERGCFWEVAVQKATFILVPHSAKSPAQAAAQSGEIAARLSELRSKTQVMVIAEDLWHRQRKMMSERVLAHCGVFTSVIARNCVVKKIDRAAANAFFDENHSYGKATYRYCYGLFTHHPADRSGLPKGTLIAVSAFSNARRWEKDGKIVRSYEWVRQAGLPNLRISGGVSKLLKAFIDEVQPDDIMSYADLEWSDGAVYSQLGFALEASREPVLFSVDVDTWRRAWHRDGPSNSQNFGSNIY